MENIKRKIKLFFVSYGRLLVFVIGIICIIIFVIQSLNKMVIEKNNKYSSEEYINQKIEKEEELKQQKLDNEYISQFIEYCNKGKIEEAYAMLSNECKKEKYSTIKEFKEKYIDKVFSINICKYKISVENTNTYIVILTQDMLITGKTDSIIQNKYQIRGVLERKLYIYD